MPVRLLRPSFSIERALYVSTVLTLTSSREAISLLLWPGAIRVYPESWVVPGRLYMKASLAQAL